MNDLSAYHFYLVEKFTRVEGLIGNDAQQKAIDHNFWDLLGYNYEDLLEETRHYNRQLEDKESTNFVGNLWKAVSRKNP